MNHLQKSYFEYVKTGRNDNKFTIGKYHMNTMEIIKLFQVNVFIPVTKFAYLTIWLFWKRRSFGQGAFQRNQLQKFRILHGERKGEKKHR